jgi:hypothetical protein
MADVRLRMRGGALDAVQQLMATRTVGEVRRVVGADSEIGPDLLVGMGHGCHVSVPEVPSWARAE